MRRRGSSARFVGRSQELRDLGDTLERAVLGQPTIVLVSGEAGVGKTRLVAEFAALARNAGARVAAGGCVELGDLTLPFAPIVEVIRSLNRTLEPAALAGFLGPGRDDAELLVPDLGAALSAIPRPPGSAGPPVGSFGERDADPATRSRRLELLLGVVQRLSADVPLLIILEDLHWADPSTLDLLAYVARNLTTERMVLLATYRTDAVPPGHPLRHLAAELARDRRVERYELGALGSDDIRGLLEAILGEAPDPALEARVVARADGNPFFVEELVAAELRAESRTVPRDLRELILDRVRRLPSPADACVRIVAIAGRGADDALIAEVSGLPATALVGAIRAAVDDQILVPLEDGTYAFRHALLGEAVADDMLPGERRRLHGAIAEARSARPLPVGPGRATEAAERARHWDGAGRPSETLGAAIVAADAAMAIAAFAEAGAQLDRALRQWDAAPDATLTTGADHPALLARAAVAWSLAGDFERAVALARSAVDEVDPRTDPGRAGQVRIRLGSDLLSVNDSAGALETFRSALDLLGDPGSATHRRRALNGSAAALMLLGRHRESAEASRSALAVDSPEAPWLEGQAREYLGVDLVSLGDTEAGLAELREARRLAAEPGSPPDVILEADHNLACMLDRADRLDEAVDVALEGAARAERGGLGRRSGIGLRGVAASALVRSGRWAEAEAVLAGRLELDPRGEQALVAHLAMAVLCVAAGRGTEAAHHIAILTSVAGREQRADSQPTIVGAAAELAIEEGRWESAAADVTREVDRLAALEDRYWIAPLVAVGVRAEAERSETIRATRGTLHLAESKAAASHLLDVARLDASRTPGQTGSTVAHAKLAEAEWTRIEARPDPAAWAAAADLFEAVPEPQRAAYARFRQAEAVLGTKGGRDAAAAPLRLAARVAAQLGAEPLRRAIDELAQRARIELAVDPDPRVAPPSPAAEDPTRALGLTRRELEILAVVALGRTNRQIAEELFITEKTVGVHMTNILGKLGVTSRIDAAAIAARLGIGRATERRPTDLQEPGAEIAGFGSVHPRVRRAFMFTDIVRSTELIGAIGDDAWVDLRRWHDDRLRAIFAEFRGEELDHAGDGFLVAFERSVDALDCAIEIQRALAGHRRHSGFAPAVRIGIHTSDATRTGSTYAGRAIHEGARIAALAGPDEIVASLDTVRDAPPRASTSAPRTVALKGIAESVAIATIHWQTR